MIRVAIPYHLRKLARVEGEIHLEVNGDVTVGSVLTALEASFPMLTGTIREHETRKRRDFIRYFVCGEDWSLESTDLHLPEKIKSGEEPFMVVGAIVGG